MRLPSFARVRPTETMQNSAPSRLTSLSAKALACAFSLFALPAIAQQPQYVQDPVTGKISTLPATAPTSMPAASASAAPTAPLAATATETPAHKPHRAEVAFNNGLLTVRANDSSLHQILSSISRQTGMRITGGVQDERVFGSYGPAAASTILVTLLDGTGVNVLMQEGDTHIPVSLVLTPRSGGATPPSITPQEEFIGMDEPTLPASVVAAPAATQPVAQSQQVVSPSLVSGPPSSPQPANNVLGSPDNVTPTASQIPTTNSVPVDSLPTPSTTVQTSQGIVDTPNPPPAGTNPTTPDQIYQQLLQLQKTRAAAAAGGTAAPPPPNPPQ